jgi:cobyrinic acid a,c-diamide synthase
MKSIIIASNSSGGGKTTFTLGLMKALKNRNLDVQGYKVGPDYIDPAFHKEVTKKSSRNLDSFLMGEDGVTKSYLKGKGDIGIIEGVMGLYDGVGVSEKASTYEISRLLGNMPIILVLSPKGQSASLCAEINGFKNYRNANIVGIVLNSISEKYYNLLKYAIEENCKIKVFGYIPKEQKISLSSRHLGLVQSMEILNLEEKLDICGSLVEEYVDLDSIINEMQELKYETENQMINYKNEESNLKNKTLRIGVALDKAFNFYYKDNLELLEELGEVIYFSPIKDNDLPENLDFLYIGGGYPEVFKEELENNHSMRTSIKKALDNGLRCYAECGGLMYLTKSIDSREMVGFFDGDSVMTNKLQNFGYCKVKINKKHFEKDLLLASNSVCSNENNLKDDLQENIMSEEYFEINAHEFHKSQVNLEEKNVYEVEKQRYDGELIKWTCGYFKGNTLAGYAHINFLGNMELIKSLINVK